MDVPMDEHAGVENLFDAIKAKDSTRVLSLIDAGINVNVKDERGRTALMIAAREGSHECMTALIYEVENINETDENGESALHGAARGGHTGCVHKLVESHANMNVKNKAGESAICIAALKGHLPCVRRFLAAGADFDLRDENDNQSLCRAARDKHYECLIALMDAQSLSLAGDNENVHMALSYVVMLVDVGHSAAARGLYDDAREEMRYACLYYAGILSLPDCLNALLEDGIDVNRRDHIGYTCIFATAFCGNLQCVLSLIRAGADVNLRDGQHRSALSRSIANGHVDCIRALVDAGTDINVRNNEGITDIFITASSGLAACMDILIEAGADVNVKDSHGNTPLFAATKEGHIDCLNTLIKAGAKVNSRDIWGSTALAYAVNYNYHECIKSLISAGGNIYLRNKSNSKIGQEALIEIDCCNFSNEDKTTAIVSAAWRGQSHVVAKLIEDGVDVNVAEDDGTTALIAAAWEGHSDIVDLILKESKANVNAADCYQRTALFAASCDGHHHCVKRILAHENVEVDEKTCSGVTPLMVAASLENSDCLTELISAGGQMDAVDEYRFTPLMYAACNESEQCLLTLIDAGAEVNTDSYRHSPLSRAIRGGSARCAEILLKFFPETMKTSDEMKHALVYTQHRRNCLSVLLRAGVFKWSWYPWLCYDGLRDLLRELVIQGYAPGQFEWEGKPCTPLLHAFHTRETGIVRYLMANLFLTNFDLFLLQREAKLHEQYKKLFTFPLRLEVLSFLEISSSLKAGGNNRHETIDYSVLSNLLPEKFLMGLKFQNPLSKLCVNEWPNIHQGGFLNLRGAQWPGKDTLMEVEGNRCRSCSSKCFKFTKK